MLKHVGDRMQKNFPILKLKCILYMFLKYNKEPIDPQICLEFLPSYLPYDNIYKIVIQESE